MQYKTHEKPNMHDIEPLLNVNKKFVICRCMILIFNMKYNLSQHHFYGAFSSSANVTRNNYWNMHLLIRIRISCPSHPHPSPLPPPHPHPDQNVEKG